MESTKLYWCLYNQTTNRQIDGLTFTQARGFLDSLSSEQISEWHAWHEGLADWKSVNEFEELRPEVKHPARHAPPRPPPRPASKISGDEVFKPVLEYRDDATRISIALDEKGYSDNRLNRRFLQSYKVQIPFLGATITNETVDVSLGGMALRDILPVQMPAAFTATLFHPNGATVKIPCQVILEKDGMHVRRCKFVLTNDTEPILRTWLLSSEEDTQA